MQHGCATCFVCTCTTSRQTRTSLSMISERMFLLSFSFFKKTLVALASAFIMTHNFTVGTSYFVSAETLAFPYRFVTNLNDLSIYYSDPYANIYGISTMRAAFAWAQDSRTSFIYPVRVSSSASSEVYCRMYSNSSSSTLASTTFYYGDVGISPNNQNWNNCVIQINHAKTVPLSTIIHEFGHTLGLKENNSNPSSIMCQTSHGRTAQSPSYADYTLVYQKYTPFVG